MAVQPRRRSRGTSYTIVSRVAIRSVLPAIRRSVTLLGLFIVDVAVLCLLFVVLGLVPIGLGILLVPTAVDATRWLAGTQRRLAGEWSGTVVPDPYRPRHEHESGVLRESQWLVTDIATWRDVAWVGMDIVVGLLLALAPISLLGYALWGLLIPFLWGPVISHWENSWYLFVQLHGGAALALPVVLGLALLALVPLVSLRALDLHSRYIAWALGPTERTRLANQVRHLSRTRQETLDSSAAELRRIERDLHDGAQSRLVAMGMKLGAAQRLLETNPEAATALLAEAKDASAKALHELRDLVRGIHPPVLADRGLSDAVRALAADCPLSVSVTSSLVGRCAPAVESAAYFAVSELLSNAVKHSGAARIEINFANNDDCLTIRILDDGHGGADPGRGSGLRGIERRLAAFDGTLTVDSPMGGPTRADIVLPMGRFTPSAPVERTS